MKGSGLLYKKNEIEQRQALIRDEKEHLLTQNADLRRRIDAITKTLVKEKESIEQQIKRVTGKDLEIRID